jgi:hypothetical protein
MESLTIKSSEKRRFPSPGSILFFTVFYLYTLLVIEPKLIYHAFGRTLYYHPFLIDWAFLGDSLTKIGGPAEYLAGFLSQCFFFSWAGAIVFTVIAWLFWFLTIRFFTLTKSHCPPLIYYLHAALLLAIYTRYGHQILSIVALLAVMTFFVFYIKFNSPNIIFATFQFSAAFGFMYYITGQAVIVFALLVGIYELFVSGRKSISVFCFLTTTGLFLVSKYLLDIPIDIIFLRRLSASQPFNTWVKYAVFIMYLIPFLIILEIALSKYIVKIRIRSQEASLHFKAKREKASKLFSYFKYVLKTTAPVVLIILTFFLSQRKTDKLVFKISYYSHNKMWQKALECARECPDNVYSIYWNHDINRALYHTGQLGNQMFSVRQKLRALLLTSDDTNIPISLLTFAKRIDLFIELGHAGVAERLAFELIESTNQCPYALERLAFINLIKHQNETAKIMLRKLSKDLVYGPQARKMLKRLETDPQLTTYEPIQKARSVASDMDNIHFGLEADNFFKQLLKKNDKNQMAFEYMMAFYLLTGQVNKLAENIGMLNNFSYDKIPSYYEEAIAIYIGSGGKKIDLHGYFPSVQTLQYVKQFDNIYKTYSGQTNKQAAKRALTNKYKNSYIYYFVFEIPR